VTKKLTEDAEKRHRNGLFRSLVFSYRPDEALRSPSVVARRKSAYNPAAGDREDRGRAAPGKTADTGGTDR
jgi:hypothetical protein